jgi:DNA polymerase
MNGISNSQMNVEKEFKQLFSLVKNCKDCDLWKNRQNPVLGEGSINAKIMFIGEAPGLNEDIQGRPFVGRAGKILDEMLESINLKRKDIYIANILKCRPPENRNPFKNEIDSCTKYLEKQIEKIKPELIVTLGSFATSYIFEKFNIKFEKIGTIHGKIFNLNTIFGKQIVIPVYHPAVATYNPNRKEVLLKDFYKIKETLHNK